MIIRADRIEDLTTFWLLYRYKNTYLTKIRVSYIYTSGQVIFIFLSIVNSAIYTIVQLKRSFLFCHTMENTTDIAIDDSLYR